MLVLNAIAHGLRRCNSVMVGWVLKAMGYKGNVNYTPAQVAEAIAVLVVNMSGWLVLMP